MEKTELQQRYLHLTNAAMRAKAAEERWPVRLNHCFQRVVLDTLFRDCWYHHLDRAGRTPAYKQLTEAQLRDAVGIAEEMLRSKELVVRLNRESLRYRGKLQD
ncbi:MAG: hypothetical protein WBA12_11965 [Catalinimonas sp.]